MSRDDDEDQPQACADRALHLLDQVTGAIGAVGVLSSAFVVMLIWIDRSNVKKSVPVPVATFVIVAGVVLAVCVVLMVCRHGMNRNERWAPRLARKVSVGLMACAPVWLMLMFVGIPVVPPVWQVILLAAFILLGMSSFALHRDLKAAISMIDSLQPPLRSAFDPVMTVQSRPTPSSNSVHADQGTDSVRGK